MISINENVTAGYDLEACAWCGGSGRGRGGGLCEVCPGTGCVMVAQPSRRCPDCLCTGRDGRREVCRACGGVGWLGALGRAEPEPQQKGNDWQRFLKFRESVRHQ